MMKNILMMIVLWVSVSAQAQQDPVLMRMNGKDILRSEFEYSFNKNKALSGMEQLTPENYVDSFVNFKLKVSAGEIAGLDTTLAFRKTVENYRNQLIKSYLTDEDITEQAVRQTYEKMKLRHHVGQVYVSHIYKYLPQNISNYALREITTRMDSIYGSLQKNNTNEAFAACVKHFSDDKNTFWVSWLQMPVEFEDIVFELPVGGISRPFYTPQGIHIVKVLERKDVLPFETMKKELIRNQTRRHGMDKGTEAQVEKLKKEYHYTPDKAGIDELMVLGQTNKPLFSLDGNIYTGKDFARFAVAYPAGMRKQLDGFIMKTILDYENRCLESKHRELFRRVQEYRDNLLLDEITRKEIGEKASADEAGLQAYFEKHRSDYHWAEQRYKGIVLHCVNKRIGKQARKFLKSLPEEEWKDAIRLTFNNDNQLQIQADQGVFSPGDNIYVDDLVFKKKEAKPLVSFPFTVVLGKKVKGPENYREIKDKLIDDYQRYLEKLWITRLRSSGKVEINQEVLKTVNKH